MKNILVFVVLFTFLISCGLCNDIKTSCKDDADADWGKKCNFKYFTKAKPEHIIEKNEKIFRLSTFKGRIWNDTGGWSENVKVLIECINIGEKVKKYSTYADSEGFFQIDGIVKGRYCYKITCDGWQSVIGRVVIELNIKKEPVFKIIMKLGV